MPPAQIFDPVTNPDGIRCTIWDSMVNVYGRDPATGYARRTLDNVGVQYGLEALQGGQISVGPVPRPERGHRRLRRQRRTSARSAAWPTRRRWRSPIAPAGSTPAPAAFPRCRSSTSATTSTTRPRTSTSTSSTYEFRQRLLQRQRHVRQPGHVPRPGRREHERDERLRRSTWSAGGWTRSRPTTSGAALAEKVIANKPADAVDACWIVGGQRIDGAAEIGASNQCETTYPPHSLPVNRAGRPLDSLALKCQLRPIDVGDYPPMTPAQQTRLASIFPDGVCDWSQAGRRPAGAGGHLAVLRARPADQGAQAQAEAQARRVATRAAAPRRSWRRS